MGRTANPAKVPILGSIFRNTSSSNPLVHGDGTVYKPLPVTYSGISAMITSVDYPVAMSIYEIGNSTIMQGAIGPTAYQGFSSLGLNTYNVTNLFNTYGPVLARGSTTFQSNKTENFYNQSREIGGNFIGYFNEGRGPYNSSYLYRFNISNGYQASLEQIRSNDVYAYYYDSLNTAHVWLCGNLKVSTADGVVFSSTTISSLPNRSGQRVPYHNRPFLAHSGNDGILFMRATSGSNVSQDYVEVYRTTNNWSSATNISSSFVPNTTYGYPHIYNYDGTRVFALFGGTDGSSANMLGYHTSTFGASVSSSTVSGAVSVFHGMSGHAPSAAYGLYGSHTAMCNGANASTFMYLSSSYGNYYAYYTSNGGQTFTSVDLNPQVALTGASDSYDGFLSLSYANNIWVALLQRGANIFTMRSTNNGSTWSNPAFLMSNQGQYASYGQYQGYIFTHNNQFVALKMSDNRVRFKKSADGLTWTDMTDPYATYAPVNVCLELDEHFIIAGRVIRKSDLTIIGFHNQPGYLSSSAYLATLATPNLKALSGFADWGSAVLTSSTINSGLKTSSLPVQYNAYSTSGSVYGAYEYMRVK